MKIINRIFYNGAEIKINRLGLLPLIQEIEEIIFKTEVFLLEQKNANGAAEIRKRLDKGFEDAKGWKQQKTGGVDWKKTLTYNSTVKVSLGVEIQVSARSDLLVRDIVHLRNSLQSGEIDLGVIVVPSDRLQEFLPDRTPSFRDAIRYIEEEFREAMTYPITVISIEHDGSGSALPKQPRKR